MELSMRRTYGLVTSAITAAVWLCCSTVTAAEFGKPLKICVLSGSDTYQSDQSLPPFEEFLQQNYNVQCNHLEKRAVDDLPGLEQLDNCDVALVYIKRMKLSGEQLERFKKYALSGRPIVGVRTASHAVQTWLEFDKEVLGGNYHNHHPAGVTCDLKVRKEAASHPILRGVKLANVSDALYKNEGHAEDISILLEGTISGQPTEPVAWTRQYKGGRIFYTSLGAQDTFQLPDFRRMLANALFWTAGREVEAKK
jgi:type 1 glutamine amidotransferase